MKTRSEKESIHPKKHVQLDVYEQSIEDDIATGQYTVLSPEEFFIHLQEQQKLLWEKTTLTVKQ